MDLEKLIEEVRIGMRPEVRGDTVQISLSEDEAKALARLRQSTGLDDYLYEATLDRSGGEWVLRGLHFVLQILRTPILAR